MSEKAAWAGSAVFAALLTVAVIAAGGKITIFILAAHAGFAVAKAVDAA